MAVRIGLAFNLKPEAPANPAGADPTSPSLSDESSMRALRDDLPQPDLYAEWDEPATIDAVEAALSTVGQVSRNKYLVRAMIGDYQVTVFPDGRAVIGGTEDIAEARSVYAKYVGN